MADRSATMRRRTCVVVGAVGLVLGACSGSGGADTTAPTTVISNDERMSADERSSADEVRVDAPVLDSSGEPVDGAEDLGALGETPVQIEDGDESIEIGVGDLPDALAEGFPLPDDFAVDVASEAGNTLGVTGTTALSVGDATSFYEVELADNGYGIDDSTIVPDVFSTFEFDGPRGPGQVAVSETPGGDGSTIVVTLD